ncbi:MAG: tryptophan halogenase family protein [Pseudomonadota bacterium]
MTRPIESITIVGGGTAGWMAATMLDTFLNRRGAGDRVAIRLIESPDTPTVGVGEATVPAMPRTLAQLEIDEREFYKRCNASYKLGVLFNGWNVDESGERMSYINPFNPEPLVRSVPASLYFNRFAKSGQRYDRSVDLARSLVDAGRGPMLASARDPRARTNFAYHFDAGEFAHLLKDTAVARGVEHVLDHVDDVELDERGFVAALQLRARGRTEVELVIDCSGFRGLIINKALGEPFESYADAMPNDTALAVQIPHAEFDRLEPATRSTALKAGWSWRVPLYHRVGTGYVFSSAHATVEEATREFLDHLGMKEGEVEPRAIKMRIGRTRRPWVKNCVAIGLSSGFVEPLESTAIFAVDMAIRWLCEYFPESDFPEAVSARYNRNLRMMFEEVRDFIALHYRLSNRQDTTYWREVQDPARTPDRLEENLALWSHVLPTPRDLETAHLFPHDTYKAVLFGKGFYEGKRLSRAATLSEAHWREFGKMIDGRRDELMHELPDHRTLLDFKRGEQAPPQPTALMMKPAKTQPARPRRAPVFAPTSGSLL